MRNFFKKIRNSNLSSQEIISALNESLSEKDWIEITSKKDIEKISTFLCQINNFEALKILLLECTNKIDKMPGDALLFFLISTIEFSSYSQTIKKLDHDYNIFKVYMNPYHLDKMSFEEELSEQIQIYTKKYERTKDDLLDKLQFARSQRLEAEVKKTLEKLIEAFPGDSGFIEEKASYFEKEAAQIISKSAKHYSKKITNEYKPDFAPLLFNADEIYQTIKNEFKNEHIKYLLEIFLCANELEIVLKIFNENKVLLKNNFWLFVDTLVHKNLFLEALSLIKDNEEHLRTEDQFNHYYYMAICLWYLNDRQSAIETMKSIAASKPNFKQTLLYLNSWLNNEKVA